MSVFSWQFFLLWAVCIVVYYSFCRKCQWLPLLAMSILFYAASITKVPYVLLSVFALTYGTAVWIRHVRNNKKTDGSTIQRVRNIIIVLCMAVLAAGRMTNVSAMLGSSYFTLKAAGYLVDVDRDERNCERNCLFYLLYLLYIPVVLQGPLNKFHTFREQFSGRIVFDYTAFMHGLQRFLWGACKKLVLCPRLEQIAVAAYIGIEGQNGFTILLGTAAYSLWFYMDFSGYMDMMLGMSATFGIEIPENFRQPFFSKSAAEFWRRWHITLGGWFRDYLMMPFAQSRYGRNMRKYFKQYGKEAGRLAPVIAGTFIVWLCTGLWHGMEIRYFVWGMYYCVIIVSSLLLEKTYRRIKKALHIDDASWWYSLFAMLRTCGVVLVANMILEAGLHNLAVIAWQLAGKSFYMGNSLSLDGLGWMKQDVIVLAAGMAAVFSVSLLKEHRKDVQKQIDNTVLPVRWGIYFVLIFYVLYFGMYGKKFDTDSFLYMQF